MNPLEINLGPLKLKNPIMPASGCFGYGREYGQYFNLKALGAIVVKAVTLKAHQGNPTPRIAETPAGMLNSIGLENQGVEHLLKEQLPFLKNYDPLIFVNVSGFSFDEYLKIIEILKDNHDIDALELNVSCPNVQKGNMQIGQDANELFKLTKAAKEITGHPLFVKLSPNVTDIVEVALAAQEGGALGLSMVNTFLGMKIDILSKKPLLGNKMGGLSGPAIRPLAIRMVYQVAQRVNIPIIGQGGIQNVDDVIEFFLAGAQAVAIGSANFQNPTICLEIIEKLPARLKELNVNHINELKGQSFL